MRRASSVDAAVSPSATLHPALQAALSSLDVQLEAELTRYRRQRHIQVRRQRDAKPMNLIAVAATGGRTQPHTTPSAPSPTPDSDPWQNESPAPLAVRTVAQQPPVPEAVSAVDEVDAVDPWMASIAPDPVTVLQPDEPAVDQQPSDYLASSEELLRSLAEEEADLRRQRETHLQERILTPLGIGSLLLLLLSSATLGYLILNPGTVQGWRLDRFWNPRSAEPVAVTPSESIAPPDTTSPDLASEEFRDLNLDTLSTLPSTTPTPAQLPSPTVLPSAATSPEPSPTAASNNIPTTVRPQTAPARPSTPSTIASPSPARVTPPQPRVTVSRRPTASAPPATRPAPRPAQRATQASRPAQPQTSRPAQRASRRPEIAPQPARRPAPAPQRSSVAPARRPATPAPSTTAARPTTPARYYVTSDYSGDRSLEQAQRVVGDAYVRNFPEGARVQLGAFSDANRARELSEQLQQQGISTQVHEQSGEN